MSSLITDAITTAATGTAAAWTSADTVLEAGEMGYETDTGNFKIGDGTTAWTDLGYSVSLPETYNIASADTVIALPDITGNVQRKTYYWTGGDGSNTFSFTVSDSSTIGGIAATLWIGEGEGFITLESDGSNWKVIKFTDIGNIADSGSNVRRSYEKRDTKLIIRGVYDSVSTSATAHGSFYSSAVTTFTYGKTFGSGDITAIATASYNPNILTSVCIDSTPATTSVFFYVIGPTSSTVGDVVFQVTGNLH